MGEIADLMLEGSMCQWCGACLDDAQGCPTVCGGCQQAHNVDQHGNELERVEKGHASE